MCIRDRSSIGGRSDREQYAQDGQPDEQFDQRESALAHGLTASTLADHPASGVRGPAPTSSESLGALPALFDMVYEAVSYTHLDVYKRQPCAQLFSFGGDTGVGSIIVAR